MNDFKELLERAKLTLRWDTLTAFQRLEMLVHPHQCSALLEDGITVCPCQSLYLTREQLKADETQITPPNKSLPKPTKTSSSSSLTRIWSIPSFGQPLPSTSWFSDIAEVLPARSVRHNEANIVEDVEKMKSQKCLKCHHTAENHLKQVKNLLNEEELLFSYLFIKDFRLLKNYESSETSPSTAKSVFNHIKGILESIVNSQVFLPLSVSFKDRFKDPPLETPSIEFLLFNMVSRHSCQFSPLSDAFRFVRRVVNFLNSFELPIPESNYTTLMTPSERQLYTAFYEHWLVYCHLSKVTSTFKKYRCTVIFGIRFLVLLWDTIMQYFTGKVILRGSRALVPQSSCNLSSDNYCRFFDVLAECLLTNEDPGLHGANYIEPSNFRFMKVPVENCPLDGDRLEEDFAQRGLTFVPSLTFGFCRIQVPFDRFARENVSGPSENLQIVSQDPEIKPEVLNGCSSFTNGNSKVNSAKETDESSQSLVMSQSALHDDSCSSSAAASNTSMAATFRRVMQMLDADVDGGLPMEVDEVEHAFTNNRTYIPSEMPNPNIPKESLPPGSALSALKRLASDHVNSFESQFGLNHELGFLEPFSSQSTITISTFSGSTINFGSPMLPNITSSLTLPYQSLSTTGSRPEVEQSSEDVAAISDRLVRQARRVSQEISAYMPTLKSVLENQIGNGDLPVTTHHKDQPNHTPPLNTSSTVVITLSSSEVAFTESEDDLIVQEGKFKNYISFVNLQSPTLCFCHFSQIIDLVIEAKILVTKLELLFKPLLGPGGFATYGKAENPESGDEGGRQSPKSEPIRASFHISHLQRYPFISYILGLREDPDKTLPNLALDHPSGYDALIESKGFINFLLHRILGYIYLVVSSCDEVNLEAVTDLADNIFFDGPFQPFITQRENVAMKNLFYDTLGRRCYSILRNASRLSMPEVDFESDGINYNLLQLTSYSDEDLLLAADYEGQNEPKVSSTSKKLASKKRKQESATNGSAKVAKMVKKPRKQSQNQSKKLMKTSEKSKTSTEKKKKIEKIVLLNESSDTETTEIEDEEKTIIVLKTPVSTRKRTNVRSTRKTTSSRSMRVQTVSTFSNSSSSTSSSSSFISSTLSSDSEDSDKPKSLKTKKVSPSTIKRKRAKVENSPKIKSTSTSSALTSSSGSSSSSTQMSSDELLSTDAEVRGVRKSIRLRNAAQSREERRRTLNTRANQSSQNSDESESSNSGSDPEDSDDESPPKRKPWDYLEGVTACFLHRDHMPLVMAPNTARAPKPVYTFGVGKSIRSEYVKRKQLMFMEVQEVVRQCLPNMLPEFINQYMFAEGTKTIIMMKDKRVFACTVFKPHPEHGYCEIVYCTTRRSMQGKGFGRAMLNIVKRHCLAVGIGKLLVMGDSDNQRFFWKCNFKEKITVPEKLYAGELCDCTAAVLLECIIEPAEELPEYPMLFDNELARLDDPTEREILEAVAAEAGAGCASTSGPGAGSGRQAAAAQRRQAAQAELLRRRRQFQDLPPVSKADHRAMGVFLKRFAKKAVAERTNRLRVVTLEWQERLNDISERIHERFRCAPTWETILRRHKGKHYRSVGMLYYDMMMMIRSVIFSLRGKTEKHKAAHIHELHRMFFELVKEHFPHLHEIQI